MKWAAVRPAHVHLAAVPRPASERLSAPKVLSHLGVMLLVSAVLGVVVSGLAIPFAGVVGFATREVADTMDDLPTELETEPLAAEERDPRRRGQPDRHDLRREPRQRLAQPGLADHGQGDRRDRGLPLLRARRARPQGHAPRAAHQPGQRRRRPGRLVDHPADGQADPDRRRRTPRRSARRRPTTPTRASSASCATRSPSSRSTPRTGSWSATSTSPTSATAPTASRRPPSTTSTSTPRTSTSTSPRSWPGW